MTRPEDPNSAFREISGVDARRQELSRQIETLRAPHLESQAHIKTEAVAVSTGGLAEYYLDPLNQLVHVCLFIEAYRLDPSSIARDLMQPPSRVLSALAALERMALTKRQGKGWQLLTTNMHLKRTSPIYRPWRNQLKLMAMTRLEMVREADSHSFAVVFSASRATFEAVRVRFLQFLKEADDEIKAAPDKNIYQMTFDLFPWTERRE